MRWNHKKRTKEHFLRFCEVVLQHERELLTEVGFCIIFIYFCFCENFRTALIFSFFDSLYRLK